MFTFTARDGKRVLTVTIASLVYAGIFWLVTEHTNLTFPFSIESVEPNLGRYLWTIFWAFGEEVLFRLWPLWLLYSRRLPGFLVILLGIAISVGFGWLHGFLLTGIALQGVLGMAIFTLGYITLRESNDLGRAFMVCFLTHGLYNCCFLTAILIWST